MRHKSGTATTQPNPSILTLILCTAWALAFGLSGFMIFREKLAGNPPHVPEEGRVVQSIGFVFILTAALCLFFVFAAGLRRFRSGDNKPTGGDAQ